MIIKYSQFLPEKIQTFEKINKKVKGVYYTCIHWYVYYYMHIIHKNLR